MCTSVYNIHCIVIIPIFHSQLGIHSYLISYLYNHSQSITILSLNQEFISHQFSNSTHNGVFSSLFDNITTSFKMNNMHIASLLISRLTSCSVVLHKRLTIQHINPIIEICYLTSHLDTHSLSNSLYLLASFIH